MKSFANKTILVTGATGLVGSNLINTLMKLKNVKVIALSRNEQKLRECFSEFLSLSNFSYIAQDISEPLVIDSQQIDYIFHAAGPIEGRIIKEFPLSVIFPNLTGTKNCLEFLKKQETVSGVKGRAIIFSSETVYGHSDSGERIVTEKDTQLADSLDAGNAAYAESKRMTEVIARAYHQQYDLDIVVVRLGYVYGYTKFQPNTAFYEIINKALRGENTIMNNYIFLKRDNIYIDDVISGLLKVACEGLTGQAYNISSAGELGNYVTIDEMATVVMSVINSACGEKKVKLLQKDGHEMIHNPGIIMSNDKLKTMGWTLTTDLKTGIKNTVHNIKANIKH